ncbi:MAG: hypothetical protein A3G35_02955 [candidate division NC10 bacterium RIFCSPLOWO2_12_FULL_66_18]|nr:MAG: hypothetical protein A3H39_02500 [candidate division NC10 bacterium RIFCSPLOWO2_02_FULL_66_22]OGB96810.1 MAG: hypothetical protein A3G35_02955 [candidate division NC10 bacterium RIFCSPLOWO2_12_FULL_66_18]
MVNLKIQRIEPPPGLDNVKPSQFPPGPPEFTPNLDKGRVKLIWLLQCAVLLGFIGVWWKLGLSPWMGATGVGVFSGLCAGLGYLMWREASTPDPLPPGSCLLWHMKAGIWLTFVAILLVGWAIAIRVNWKESFWPGLVFCSILVVLEILTLPMSRYAITHRATPWFQFTVGVTLVPVLVAWILATFTSWLNPRLSGSAASGQSEQTRREELAKRETWAKHRGWRTAGGRPIIIAVALSGGGYRAAAIHAGLLQALDESCVPIRYLSTVSGGSIIGAYYALGYPPTLFRKTLLENRPGLPDDFLSMHWVFLDWFWGKWNSADTYARHFRNVFFESKRLVDTSPAPLLLINATDIEEDADHAREVFYKGRHQNYPELDHTLLADLVAASGAFPGAFQPKKIRWMPARGPGVPRIRRFVDGGVVENLGVEGLDKFRRLKGGGRPFDEPDLSIISDASRRSRSDDLPMKVELLQLLSRSQGISYDSLHRFLYKQVKGKRILPIRATQESGMATLRSYEFRSKLTNRRAPPIPGNVVAAEVATYDTLKELTPIQVEKAFWVGHTLGWYYWTRINAVRERLGGSGVECPEP